MTRSRTAQAGDATRPVRRSRDSGPAHPAARGITADGCPAGVPHRFGLPGGRGRAAGLAGKVVAVRAAGVPAAAGPAAAPPPGRGILPVRPCAPGLTSPHGPVPAGRVPGPGARAVPRRPPSSAAVGHGRRIITAPDRTDRPDRPGRQAGQTGRTSSCRAGARPPWTRRQRPWWGRGVLSGGVPVAVAGARGGVPAPCRTPGPSPPGGGAASGRPAPFPTTRGARRVRRRRSYCPGA